MKIYGGGRISGHTFKFCKAMGWNLNCYQKIFLTRLLYSEKLRSFVPACTKSFEKFWWDHAGVKKKHDWHVLHIEEFAYMEPKQGTQSLIDELKKYQYKPEPRGITFKDIDWAREVVRDHDHMVDAFLYAMMAQPLTRWEKIKMWFRHRYWRARAFLLKLWRR